MPPTRSMQDSKRAFLLKVLGVTGMGQTMDDLEKAFYEGVIAGTVSLGGAKTSVSPAVGQFLMTPAYPGAGTNAQGFTVLNEMFYEPFIVETAMTIDQVNGYVDVGVATSVVRFGIYRSDGTNGLPGTKMAETPTVATATNGVVVSGALVAVCSPGLYWASVVPQVASGQGIRAVDSTGFTVPGLAAIDAANVPSWKVSQTGVSGALPATATPVITRAANLKHYELGLRRSA